MHLLTVVNKTHPGLDLWKHTAALAGHAPTVLWAPPTSKLGHESKWFGQKFVTLDAHLATLPEDDWALVTDGFDVVVLDSPDVLEGRIRERVGPTQLLVAAEVFENPDKGNPYKTLHQPFPFLNSGVYAGRVAAIREALRPALLDPRVLELDDQRYFTQQYFARPDTIVLDHTASVFVCLAGVSQLSFEGRRLVVNNQKPSVLHFQGYFKNTLGILPHLFPSDPLVAVGAKALHRQPNAWTPVGDWISALGRPLPFGDKVPFLMGVLVLLFACVALILDLQSRVWRKRM
jgi:hypothetical protein